MQGETYALPNCQQRSSIKFALHDMGQEEKLAQSESISISSSGFAMSIVKVKGAAGKIVHSKSQTWGITLNHGSPSRPVIKTNEEMTILRETHYLKTRAKKAT
jgi:acetate kinase